VVVERGAFVYGIRTVEPAVALAQAVLESERHTAVSLMDSARRLGVVDDEAFAYAQEWSTGHRGCRRREPWWALSDKRADSPAETVARLRCSDLGVPPDAIQLPIRSAAGSFVARADLAWCLPDGRWLLGEIDGFDYHSSRQQHLSDLERQNRLLTSDVLLRRWTGGHAYSGRLSTDVYILLENAGWKPGQSVARELVVA
jgi:hypothetical protein